MSIGLTVLEESLEVLKQNFEGDVLYDDVTRRLFATDASVYRQLPMGVAYPKGESDIRLLVKTAHKFGFSLIPRAGGTSLCGQVVGSGLVVDVSRYMDRILEVNTEHGYARVQPGVILDELNRELKKVGRMFGPETSTSSRCTLGGMLGNNSCGSRSIVFGSTRDHVLSARVVLSDSSVVVFENESNKSFDAHCAENSFVGTVYRQARAFLSNPEHAKMLHDEFPKSSIRRRNTGYALDILLGQAPFNAEGPPFNFCSLLAGSEGTLAFVTEIKVNIVPILPSNKSVVAVHLESIREAALATILARTIQPTAVELIDRRILECASRNIEQQRNMFFLDGIPEALLIVEFHGNSKSEVDKLAQRLIDVLRLEGYGYHYPILHGEEVSMVWALRKAGLGTLANLSSDARAVACIEDTAVSVDDLPSYLEEFQKVLDSYKRECVYYGHIGDGELHLRPVLDLRKGPERAIFQKLTSDVADLVKRYKGSLSGEHGDGRVRGPFVEKMIGAENYSLLCELKNTWDPKGIFNPGKITGVPNMAEDLRAKTIPKSSLDTHFRFSNAGSLLKLAENCNGSGDCRKTHLAGGTMCPSYMATRNERDSTRGRANLLRERILYPRKKNPLADESLYEILDLCISCKACKSECPSNVDMAMMKAEVLQHYYDENGTPIRTRLIAEFPYLASVLSKLPGTKIVMNQPLLSGILKHAIGFSLARNLPDLGATSLRDWIKKNPKKLLPKQAPFLGKIALFCDEFTNYNEQSIGIKFIELAVSLGYEVIVPRNLASGRTHLSKGMVRRAKALAEENVRILAPLISDEIPLVGIEPSAILSFRDEYPELVNSSLLDESNRIAKHCYLFEEWLAKEMNHGRVSVDSFTRNERSIILHGHCQQKSLSKLKSTVDVLSLPENYKVEVISSGCCGMAGSFGYEKKHFDLSMKIGELVLFPEIRKLNPDTTVVASGTSCRVQIKDGTKRDAFHPIEILWEALLK